MSWTLGVFGSLGIASTSLADLEQGGGAVPGGAILIDGGSQTSYVVPTLRVRSRWSNAGVNFTGAVFEFGGAYNGGASKPFRILEYFTGAPSESAWDLDFDGPLIGQYAAQTAQGVRFTGRRALGASRAAPAAVVVGTQLGNIEFAGYPGSGGYQDAASLVCVVDSGTVSPTSMPGMWSIRTTPDGQVVPVARWEIRSTGHFEAYADNTYDIGTAGGKRPRSGYFGTSVVVGGGSTISAAIVTAGDRFRLRGFFTSSPSDPPVDQADLIIIDDGVGTPVLRARYNDAGVIKSADLALS